MKKSTKIALALLTGGVACCITAGILGAGNIISNGGFHTTTGQEVSEDKNLVSDSSVQRLKLDIDAAEVIIQEGTDWNLTAGKSTKWNISGGTLVIEQGNRFNWLTTTSAAPIVLTVPSGSLQGIDIELDAGKIEMSDLAVEKYVTCSIDAGAVSMERMTVNGALEVECDAGQIDFSGAVCGAVHADCDMGQINLQLLEGSTVGRVSGDVDMGTLNLSVNGKSYLTGGTLSDSVYVNLPGAVGSDLLTVNCDMGTINVNVITG